MEQCIQEMQYNMMKEYKKKLQFCGVETSQEWRRKKLFNKDSDFNGGWKFIFVTFSSIFLQ